MIDLERIKSIKGKLAGQVDHHDVSEPTISEFMEIVEWAIAIREAQGVPVSITDEMAIAFHAATTDSALGSDDMEEIKSGLQAVTELFTVAQLPVEASYDELFNAIGKAVNIQGEALSISVKAFREALSAAPKPGGE